MLVLHKPSVVLRVGLFICLAFTFAGCQCEKKERETIDRLDELFWRYQCGSVNEAKDSVYRAIEVLDNAGGKISEEYRLQCLKMAYCRLFYLARTEGDLDLANSAFIMAKEYYSKRMEVEGLSDDERKKRLDQFTQEPIFEAFSASKAIASPNSPME